MPIDDIENDATGPDGDGKPIAEEGTEVGHLGSLCVEVNQGVEKYFRK